MARRVGSALLIKNRPGGGKMETNVETEVERGKRKKETVGRRETVTRHSMKYLQEEKSRKDPGWYFSR